MSLRTSAGDVVHSEWRNHSRDFLGCPVLATLDSCSGPVAAAALGGCNPARQLMPSAGSALARWHRAEATAFAVVSLCDLCGLSWVALAERPFTRLLNGSC